MSTKRLDYLRIHLYYNLKIYKTNNLKIKQKISQFDSSPTNNNNLDDINFQNKQQLVFKKSINKVEMNYVLIKLYKQNSLLDMVQFMLLFFILILIILIFYYFINHIIKFMVKFIRFIGLAD